VVIESLSESAATPDLRSMEETAEQFMALQAASWTPQPPSPLPEPEPKKSGLFRSRKSKVKVSKGFEYTVPPRGSKKDQAASSNGPVTPAAREITCPRCGQPSPRGLCEACEDALSQLRQLTVSFLDE
jgi:hypothetical protein